MHIKYALPLTLLLWTVSKACTEAVIGTVSQMAQDSIQLTCGLHLAREHHMSVFLIYLNVRLPYECSSWTTFDPCSFFK